MKRAVGLCLMVLAVAVTVVLAAQRSSAQAPPVATIALPEPGEAMELFPGCNFISLTFPDGTATQAVVDAVTPPETVQALWRQTPSLDRFEGFSPAFPQASDLLSVNFLDPVWICLPLGPLPAPTSPTPAVAPLTGTPTPAPAVSATPTPAAQLTADLALTDLLLQTKPQGNVVVQLKNNGPDSLVNVNVDVWCSTVDVKRYDGSPASGQEVTSPIPVSLSSGQTADFQTGLSIDISQAAYVVSCEVKPAFIDPDPTNNYSGLIFSLDADLAVTDIVAPNLPPYSNLYVHITNNGPDSLVNTAVLMSCSVNERPYYGMPSGYEVSGPLTATLSPGQTGEFATGISVNTEQARYDVTCTVDNPLYDHNAANNEHSETFPAAPG
jgi:hypothetical protein